jgi:hypothetical protein
LQNQLALRANENLNLEAHKKKKKHHHSKTQRLAGKALLQILTQHGKDKSVKKDKKDKKRKKNKRVKREGGGPDSSPTDSSPISSGEGDSDNSGSSSSEQEDADKLEAPLKRRSQKRPGSVLQLLVQHAKQQLDQTSKVDVDPNNASLTSGVKIASYFSIVIRPQLGNALAQMREMHHIATCLDLLRKGDLSRQGDVLAARFMSLHQSVIDGSWTAARHLEIAPLEDSSAAGPGVVLEPRKHARLTAKAEGREPLSSWRPPQKGKGGKGKPQNWGESDWGSGPKGKGKIKGRGKSKGWWSTPGQDAYAEAPKTKEKPGEKTT